MDASESGRAERIVLAPNLDLNAGAKLREDLLAKRGAALEVDASQVQRVGALCLQVLIAARHEWEHAKLSLIFTSPSAQFDEGIRLMGAGAVLGAADAVGGLA